MVNRSALMTERAATLYARRLSLRETASAVNHCAFPWKNRLSDDKLLLLLLLLQRAAKLGIFLVGRASWSGLPFLASLNPRPIIIMHAYNSPASLIASRSHRQGRNSEPKSSENSRELASIERDSANLSSATVSIHAPSNPFH